MDGREEISRGCDLSFPLVALSGGAPFLHLHNPVSHRRVTKLAVVKIIVPKNMAVATVEVAVFASARM